MGQCLSCCEQPYRPTQNGHHSGAAPSKAALGGGSGQRSSVTTPATMSSTLPSVRDGAGDVTHRRVVHVEKPTAAAAAAAPGGGGSPPATGPSEARLTALFERYSDATEPDCILADGTERLCSDLQLHPEEFRVLLLAWRLDAQTMCRFTRDQFIGGCRAMCVDSLHGLRERLQRVEQEEVSAPAAFRDLYRWAYRFALDPGERTLPVGVASALWRVVFSRAAPPPPPLLARWLAFLGAHPRVRAIPRDTWDMFLHFTETVGDDLTTYDDTDAWPSLFDDFVEYENDCHNQNVKSDKPVWE